MARGDLICVFKSNKFQKLLWSFAGNEFSSEAVPGALPVGQNNPQVRALSKRLILFIDDESLQYVECLTFCAANMSLFGV